VIDADRRLAVAEASHARVLGIVRERSAPMSRRSVARHVAVSIGGAGGALARWSVGLALAKASTSFPWGTLVVNLTGAFGLGFAIVLMTERLRPSRYLRPLIGVGFFGAYTTFSTMAVEGVRLIDAGRSQVALAYWVVTLVVGQAAGVYGMWLGRVRLGSAKEAT